MAQSKVTHIYPIKQGFEKTHIKLQLMLQWGPESERCYRTKRLEFQGPANKRQSSPWRKKGERGRWWGVGMGYKGAVTSEWHEVCGFVRYILKKYETTKKHFMCCSCFVPFSFFMSWSREKSKRVNMSALYLHACGSLLQEDGEHRR